jgi:predicted transcriptional regulator
MARKKGPKMPAVTEPAVKKAVRLELPTADYKRLERQARKLDRAMSYVARQAVMEWVKAREKGGDQ